MADIYHKVSELKTMDLISILFYFIFLLFSLILYCWVEDKEDKVWHCHRSHIIMWCEETI